MLMFPPPPGFVNSLSSMPIFRSTHSMGSKAPVRMPMRGMSPSPWFLGMVKVPAGTLLGAHELVTSTVNCRRQRPSWTTSGRLPPTGTPVSVKVPSGAV